MFKPLNNTQWPTQGAILLAGNSQEKQEKLALEYVKKLLCQSLSQSTALESARALLDANTHTDFRLICPEVDSRWIKIDQIRSLMDWAQGTPQIAKQKIAVISPAHTMNLQAANALLKTLEEASAHMLFILVTDKASALPATIRSRCYWIRTRTTEPPLPSSDLSALQNCLMENLRALKSKQEDPISIGQEWIKHDPKEVLVCLIVIFYEALHHKVLAQGGVSGRFKNPQGWAFLDQLLAAQRALEEPNPPNIQLLFESLLMEYKTSILF